MTTGHATPPLLKDLNERTVLEAIRVAAPISRAEISRRVGISKPTVSLALQSLLRAGLVREAPHDGEGPSYGATFFEPVAEAAFVLGLDLGARFVRGAVCDVRGEVRARQDLELAEPDATAALDTIEQLAGSLLARERRRAEARRQCRARRPRRGPGIVDQACDERGRSRGLRLRRRGVGTARPDRLARERHQPGCARRALARCRARSRRLRLHLDRHRPRCGTRPARRAAPRPHRSSRRARLPARRDDRGHRSLRGRVDGIRGKPGAAGPARPARRLRGRAGGKRGRWGGRRGGRTTDRAASRADRSGHRRRSGRPRRRHRRARRSRCDSLRSSQAGFPLHRRSRRRASATEPC